MRHSVALEVFVYWVAMYMPCSAAGLSTVTPGYLMFVSQTATCGLSSASEEHRSEIISSGTP